ncbi:hypothetical protein ACLOJK_026642 [Asimina triloba]
MTFEATGFPPEILREVRYLLQRGAYVVRCAAKHLVHKSGPPSNLTYVATYCATLLKWPFLLPQVASIQCAGFSSPTPIQAQTWPIALQSRDIVAIAKTGSGKTLGYLLPAFVHLKRCRNNPQIGPTVLVLAPTRELATQIQDEAIKFGRTSRITCAVGPLNSSLFNFSRGRLE